MMWFWFGLAVGVLLAVLPAAIVARRWTRRARRLEQRARGAERLAELGTLTGGLAHEIKNPLSTVSVNVQLIQEDLAQLADELPTETGEHLRRIDRRFDSLNRETQRLGDILKDFLQFAGRVKLECSATNVNNLIDELCDFFLPQAQAANVRLRTQFDTASPMVNIDRDLFKQAMLNLMINACQAMTDARHNSQRGGQEDELIIRTQQQRGFGQLPELLVHVIDTGPGMAPKVVATIFHPYMSTKKSGTGLGLPTARRIIEEHGGSLTCHSEPQRGTDFVIALPLEEATEPT